jgi:hypothetical protein
MERIRNPARVSVVEGVLGAELATPLTALV